MRLSARLPAAALALAIAAAPSPTLAHAVVLESTPAPDATVPAGNIDCRLKFNGRIDAARSRLSLIGPDGKARALPQMAENAVDRLSARAEGLTPGRWRIQWQVLAADGHVTRGEIPFSVAPARP
ncbi:MAG: copper resistance CopC family protein [Alphaproteobacteria bacterium]